MEVDVDEDEDEDEDEERRCSACWKSNTTFGGMKRRSVAVDVEGRRGD